MQGPPVQCNAALVDSVPSHMDTADSELACIPDMCALLPPVMAAAFAIDAAGHCRSAQSSRTLCSI